MAQLRPRYLHRDVARGYTESLGSALPDEPEAVPALDQERISKIARQKWETEQADKIARRESASWLRRLVAAELIALEHGFDISRHQVRIRGEIKALEAEVAKRERKAKAVALRSAR